MEERRGRERKKKKRRNKEKLDFILFYETKQSIPASVGWLIISLIMFMLSIKIHKNGKKTWETVQESSIFELYL